MLGKMFSFRPSDGRKKKRRHQKFMFYMSECHREKCFGKFIPDEKLSSMKALSTDTDTAPGDDTICTTSPL